MPGETAYTLLDQQDKQPPLGKPPVQPKGSPQPWYETLWGSVRAADGN